MNTFTNVWSSSANLNYMKLCYFWTTSARRVIQNLFQLNFNKHPSENIMIKWKKEKILSIKQSFSKLELFEYRCQTMQ